MLKLAMPDGLKRILPALLALALVLIGIATRPLIPIDETRYLTVAWEIHQGGNWLAPHLNGQPYIDKPPFLFWLINAVWLVTGPSEFWGRLTPSLFLPVTVLLTGVLGRKLGGDRVGLTASWVTVGVTALSVMFSLVMFDALLTSAVLAGLIGWVDAAQGRKVRAFVIAGIALGLGALIKGPLILIHVLPVALAAPLWAPRLQRWGDWYAGVGASLVIGFAIGLGWAFSAAAIAGPEYGLDKLLGDQTADRMVNAFTHGRPWWFFIALAPVFFFPWWLSRGFWGEMFRKGQDRRIYRLCWIMAGVVFLAFSLISSKQAHYVVPAIPVLAVAFAGLVCSAQIRRKEFVLPLVLAAVGVIMVALHFVYEDSKTPVDIRAGLFVLAVAPTLWLARERLVLAGVAASVSVFLAVHLLCATGTLAPQDSSWVARILAERRDAPMAVIGAYEGEWGFAARLTTPIEEITLETNQAWRAAHPDGIVIEIARRAPKGGPYNESRLYRGGTLAIHVPGVSAVAGRARAASGS